MTTGGVVYLTDSIDEARGYGDAVISVTFYDETPTRFQSAPYSDATEFYATVDQISSDAAISVI